MDILLLFFPLLISGLGFWMFKFPPKKINNFAGYRTNLTMKNQTTWDYAQKLMGKKFIKYGIFLLIATLLLGPIGSLTVGIFDIASCIGLLCVVAKTEIDFYKVFNSTGEFQNIVSVDEKNLKNEEVKNLDKKIENSTSKEDLIIVKEIIKYLANFKKEDLDKFKEVKFLMEDPKVKELFYKYSNSELINKYSYLEEYYNKIHFNKPKLLKKTR